MGGAALFRPAQGTVFPTFESTENEVKKLINDPVNWVIFTTGMGVEAIWSAAVQSSLQPKLLQVLRSVRIAARGYKTVNALKKLGLAPEVCDDDGSNAGLIRALTTRDLHGKRIALQLHGDPSPALVNF